MEAIAGYTLRIHPELSCELYVPVTGSVWLRLDGELDEKSEKGKPQVHLQSGKAGLE